MNLNSDSHEVGGNKLSSERQSILKKRMEMIALILMKRNEGMLKKGNKKDAPIIKS
ncbi:hypothetical protein [Paenibacillus sp. L3-i20]|uniref:hypothetical protein n=1 Tax=Paenibacillus sp. L3-i20 TaxID=2905833 RepID=UPI001EE0DECC|nr:hypothetical protein [Paenibacillus sp. L3-i20]GKU76232.1 hypothetical protein L3i20_v206290 [Paenibacillus sp. L3-i20]